MTALRRVQVARAVAWWIDQQIAGGRTDDEIAAMLPLAHAVITGRVRLADVAARLP